MLSTFRMMSLSVLYISFFFSSLLADKNDKYIEEINLDFINPMLFQRFSLTYNYQKSQSYSYNNTKLLRCITEYDSLPQLLKDTLNLFFTEKIGPDWEDKQDFIRADLVEWKPSKYSRDLTYHLWFDIPVGREKIYNYKFKVLFDSVNNDIIYHWFTFPTILKTNEKYVIFSVIEAWQIAKNELRDLKRVKLQNVGFGVNDSRTNSYYLFMYKRKGRNNYWHIFINAHNGKVILHKSVKEIEKEGIQNLYKIK